MHFNDRINCPCISYFHSSETQTANDWLKWQFPFYIAIELCYPIVKVTYHSLIYWRYVSALQTQIIVYYATHLFIKDKECFLYVCLYRSFTTNWNAFSASGSPHSHTCTYFSGIKFLELLYHLVLPFFIYAFWCYVPLHHSHTIIVGMVPVVSSVQTS